MTMTNFTIKPATEDDAPLILAFIQDLAEYEHLAHRVVATEEMLFTTLFGPQRMAEVIIGYSGDAPISFALFFHTFSSFLGQAGIYIEDLFVKEAFRTRGVGRAMVAYLAKLAQERKCCRLEWAVLNWNEPAIAFYKGLGAGPKDGWIAYRLTGDALHQLAQD